MDDAELKSKEMYLKEELNSPGENEDLTGENLELTDQNNAESSADQDASHPAEQDASHPADQNDESFPDLGEDLEVLSFVGRGGMGTVYKVRDLKTDKLIAVKVLNADVSQDKVALKRFEQEVASAAELTHPNLVSIYRHGSTNESAPYMVMDYYQGRNMSSLLKEEGPLETERAIDLFLQLGSALSHAHGKGVVHRDVKPNNVIISNTDDGGEIARVVDFGIAKMLPSSNRETLSFTETGEVFGSPDYMSPEQCLGFSLDERSDIYSLGCLMYETLTGKTPFSGSNPIQLVVKHINDEVADFPPECKNTKLGRGLESIVLKCLDKEPDERFQSVDELVTDLKRLKEGKYQPKYRRRKEEKPTFTTTDTFSHSILSMFGLVAFICLLMYFFYDSMGSGINLVFAVLFAGAGFVFGKQVLAGRKRLWQDKSLKRWWKKALSLSSFVFSVSISWMLFWYYASYIFTGRSPESWMNYTLGWIAILSALCIANSAIGSAGSLLIRSERLLSWKKFIPIFLGLVVTTYSFCALATPKLAAKLPAVLAAVSFEPANFWLYDRALALDPKNDTALEKLLSRAEDDKKYDKAIKYASGLIETKRKKASWYKKRSRYYAITGDIKKALADNRLALNSDPDEGEYESLVSERVEMLLKENKTNMALSFINKMVYKDPGSLKYASIRAAVNARLGNLGKAISNLNEMIGTKADQSPYLYLQRGEYYRKLGNQVKAFENYRTALRLSIQSGKEGYTEPAYLEAYLEKVLGNTNAYQHKLKEMKESNLEKIELGYKINTHFSNVSLDW